MYREIKVGEKNIPMLANGATPLRYRMVFGKDIIAEFEHAESDSGRATSSISELAYIMTKAAEAQNGGEAMSTLNMESYIDWLEQFEPLDLTLSADEIIDLYMGNGKTLSEGKKKVEDAVKET